MVEVNIKDKLLKVHDISMDNSILIIGKGETEYRNKEIIKVNNITEVKYCYGEESDLTRAYKEAIEIGAKNIFLCNCYLYTDYITVLDNINTNEYTFITPLFNFSDTYITKTNKKVYLCEIYSNSIGSKLTQLIFTDRHASLYEDIEQYLKDMSDIYEIFKNTSINRLEYGDNFCFVLNNLKKYNFANVALASILVQSDLKYYPQMDIGEVVYDITNNDVYGQDIVYFGYNTINKTTIENFLNFYPKPCPEKFIPIHLLIQIIKRKLIFEDFSGKLLTPYLRIQLENSIIDKMEEFVGTLIESYKIKNIDYVKTEKFAVIVYIKITIKPYNSIEEVDITMEV